MDRCEFYAQVYWNLFLVFTENLPEHLLDILRIKIFPKPKPIEHFSSLLELKHLIMIQTNIQPGLTDHNLFDKLLVPWVKFLALKNDKKLFLAGIDLGHSQSLAQLLF